MSAVCRYELEQRILESGDVEVAAQVLPFPFNPVCLETLVCLKPLHAYLQSPRLDPSTSFETHTEWLNTYAKAALTVSHQIQCYNADLITPQEV